jgi:osmotically-inducible protein OsmY
LAQQPGSGAMPPGTAPPESLSVPTQNSGTADTILTARAKAALVGASGVDSGDVHVTTTRGVVRLTGRVPTRAQRDKAGQAVQSLDGVNAVQNDLIVGGPAK